MFAAVTSLISNSVATAFGAVGTPVKVLAEQAGIADIQTLSTHVVLQLSPLMILVPFVLAFMTDSRLKVLPKNIFLSLLIGGTSLITQYLCAKYMGAETPAIIGSIMSIIVTIIYAKLAEPKSLVKPKSSFTLSEGIRAWSVYGFILFLVILTSPLLPIKNILAPLLTSSFKFMILDGPSGSEIARVVKISWLTDTGTILFVGAMLGGLFQGANFAALFKLLGKVVLSLKNTIITVCCLISLSSIMDFSGMIATLGIVLAAATGPLYPLFAPTIGCLGTFLTGSDTSSNILFGKLQASVGKTLGINPDWIAAANTTGATGGKIISPQSIAVATSAIGESGKEGEIMKQAIPFALGYIVIAGLVTYFVPKLLGNLL